MNLKDKVLNCLEENRDSYLSGEELAALFGVSRAAVWKAVRKLQEDGCGITAAPGKGYRLSSGSDILSASGISRLLGEGWEERIIVRKEVDSTNNLAKELALRGASTAPSSWRKNRRREEDVWAVRLNLRKVPDSI